MNLERIREKYWNRGDETEFRVVQNRYYKKAHKVELGLFGGIASSDPFLVIREAGGTLGYHFNEYFAFSALYMKFLTNTSSAYSTFKAETAAVEVNYNKPKQFYGGELGYSPIYGKLSLMGKMIIYYDLHLLGGAGLQETENGKYFAPVGGIGQQIYISKLLSIRLDYRMMFYSEDIVERQGSTLRGTVTGQKIGTRSNQTSVITLGATFLLGGG